VAVLRVKIHASGICAADILVFGYDGFMRVYLDNCCYNRPYDKQNQPRIQIETVAKLQIQELVRNGVLELVCSFISRFENGKNPNESNRISIEQFFHYAVDYIGLENISRIRDKRNKFVSLGVKMKDAAHLACAVEAGCEYLITTDDRFVKRCKGLGIVVCNPVTFLAILGRRKQCVAQQS
jgi:predicted nucleic acid-binding protein